MPTTTQNSQQTQAKHQAQGNADAKTHNNSTLHQNTAKSKTKTNGNADNGGQQQSSSAASQQHDHTKNISEGSSRQKISASGDSLHVHTAAVDTFYLSASDWPACMMQPAYLDSSLKSEKIVPPSILQKPTYQPKTDEEIAFDNLMKQILDVNNVKPIYGPKTTIKKMSLRKLYAGFEGKPRIDAIQNRIWFTPMIFVAFILLGLVFSLRSKALFQDIKDFFGINHRRSVSDAPRESHTRYHFALVLVGLFNISMLALFAVVRNSPIHTTSYEISLAAFFAITGSYILFKEVVIFFMGYVFIGFDESKMWSRAFLFLIEGLGILLSPSILCLSFAPSFLSNIAIGLGLVIVALAELTLIMHLLIHFSKFRFSFPYLILYLCTLEILPAIALILGYIYAVEMV